MLRQRPNVPGTSPPAIISSIANTTAMDNPRAHLLDRQDPDACTTPTYNTTDVPTSIPEFRISPIEADEMDLSNLSRKSQWIILAIASGACAAFNGVFAKLTTTELTTSFAASIAHLLGLGSGAKTVEVVIRAMFFGLNLIFNGIMWTLFTQALARGTSTTQVSIINTSANFMLTAVLGFLIFSESLPPLWWVGAALLVAGNVIIGRREEKDAAADPHAENARGDAENSHDADGEEGEGLLSDSVELMDESEVAALKKASEAEEDILDLGTPVDIVRR